MPEIDPRQFRQVLGRFATGVTAVTAVLDGEVYGMTANAFMAGSLDPPLCVISIGNGARMHERLQQAGAFGVSFLSEGQADLSLHFAGRPLAGLEAQFRYHEGIPVLLGTVGSLVADIVDHSPCGDHTLFVGQVKYLRADDREPLLFFAGQYRNLAREDVPAHDAPPLSFWWS